MYSLHCSDDFLREISIELLGKLIIMIDVYFLELSTTLDCPYLASSIQVHATKDGFIAHFGSFISENSSSKKSSRNIIAFKLLKVRPKTYGIS